MINLRIYTGNESRSLNRIYRIRYSNLVIITSQLNMCGLLRSIFFSQIELQKAINQATKDIGHLFSN